jgi:hypothetical protein
MIMVIAVARVDYPHPLDPHPSDPPPEDSGSSVCHGETGLPTKEPQNHNLPAYAWLDGGGTIHTP